MKRVDAKVVEDAAVVSYPRGTFPSRKKAKAVDEAGRWLALGRYARLVGSLLLVV